jgi:hypothetical protein
MFKSRTNQSQILMELLTLSPNLRNKSQVFLFKRRSALLIPKNIMFMFIEIIHDATDKIGRIYSIVVL